MGFLRGLNLLLGISLIPALLPMVYYVSIFPLIYIFAITMISRGEVHGGSRTTLYRAMGLYLFVDLGILIFAIILFNLILTLVFIIFQLAYFLHLFLSSLCS